MCLFLQGLAFNSTLELTFFSDTTLKMFPALITFLNCGRYSKQLHIRRGNAVCLEMGCSAVSFVYSLQPDNTENIGGIMRFFKLSRKFLGGLKLQQ